MSDYQLLKNESAPFS